MPGRDALMQGIWLRTETVGSAYDLNADDLSFEQVRPSVDSFSFGVVSDT